MVTQLVRWKRSSSVRIFHVLTKNWVEGKVWYLPYNISCRSKCELTFKKFHFVLRHKQALKLLHTIPNIQPTMSMSIMADHAYVSQTVAGCLLQLLLLSLPHPIKPFSLTNIAANGFLKEESSATKFFLHKHDDDDVSDPSSRALQFK
jgi:hypothetical protein